VTISPRCIIHLVVSTSALTWFLEYIYDLNLIKNLNNVIYFKNKANLLLA
jgi:hypothetical protein